MATKRNNPKQTRHLVAQPEPEANAEANGGEQEAEAHGSQGQNGKLVVVKTDPSFLTNNADFKVKRQVTVPVLQFAPGQTIVFAVKSAIKQSNVSDGKMGPAQVCEVVAPNGSLRLLVVGKVLQGALTNGYPNDGYVGKWFAVTKLAERKRSAQGLEYSDYGVAEIEPPARR